MKDRIFNIVLGIGLAAAIATVALQAFIAYRFLQIAGQL